MFLHGDDKQRNAFVVGFGEPRNIISRCLGAGAAQGDRDAGLKIDANGKVCCTPFIDNGMTVEERIVLQGLDEGDVGSSGSDDHVVDSVC